MGRNREIIYKSKEIIIREFTMDDYEKSSQYGKKQAFIIAPTEGKTADGWQRK